MGLYDGDWDSEIKFDEKLPDESGGYASDGVLHICPSVNTEFRGQQTVPAFPETPEILKPIYFQDGSCIPEGDDRFTIKYSRPAPTAGTTYHYVGSGRVLNKGKGPTYIYGRVKVTSEGGAPGSNREGTWEAVRRGDSRGPGPGEDGELGTSHGEVEKKPEVKPEA